jgi:hypothetical protein
MKKEKKRGYGLHGADAVGRDIHFADTLEREQQFYEELRGILRGLTDDRADGIGDGGVEEHAFDHHSRQIGADALARFEHGSILVPRSTNCNRGGETQRGKKRRERK